MNDALGKPSAEGPRPPEAREALVGSELLALRDVSYLISPFSR